tara:strand:+ start:597 stop:1319 length:723 start_codon:yes stop_codon:yes gene_type:complete
MPDITKIAHTNDSYLANSLSTFAGGTTWSQLVADATAATHNNSAQNFDEGVHNGKFQGRGTSNTWECNRSLFPFDLSGESGTVASAQFKVYSDNLGDTGTNQSTVFLTNWNALDGDTGDYDLPGTLTSFGSTTISTTAGYHTIDINSDGITAINSVMASGTLTVGLLGYYDYNDTDPGTSNEVKIKIYYANSLSAVWPKLELTLGTSGYSHNVLGVASADIASVNGVATANIASVNGVDT